MPYFQQIQMPSSLLYFYIVIYISEIDTLTLLNEIHAPITHPCTNSLIHTPEANHAPIIHPPTHSFIYTCTGPSKPTHPPDCPPTLSCSSTMFYCCTNKNVINVLLSYWTYASFKPISGTTEIVKENGCANKMCPRIPPRPTPHGAKSSQNITSSTGTHQNRCHCQYTTTTLSLGATENHLDYKHTMVPGTWVWSRQSLISIRNRCHW